MLWQNLFSRIPLYSNNEKNKLKTTSTQNDGLSLNNTRQSLSYLKIFFLKILGVEEKLQWKRIFNSKSSTFDQIVHLTGSRFSYMRNKEDEMISNIHFWLGDRSHSEHQKWFLLLVGLDSIRIRKRVSICN